MTHLGGRGGDAQRLGDVAALQRGHMAHEHRPSLALGGRGLGGDGPRGRGAVLRHQHGVQRLGAHGAAAHELRESSHLQHGGRAWSGSRSSMMFNDFGVKSGWTR